METPEEIAARKTNTNKNMWEITSSKQKNSIDIYWLRSSTNKEALLELNQGAVHNFTIYGEPPKET